VENPDHISSPRLREALASPETKRRYVRRLFSTIADRYDLITALLSYGQDRRWKQRVARLSAAGPGTRALDLACGTGDIAFALARRGAHVAGLDITHRMVQLARTKGDRARAGFVTGDMMALPFGDGLFDVVTTGYGLRNVPDIQQAIAEIHRVLKPGGVLLSLDFNRPLNPFVRVVYLAYLTVVGSALGFVLHGDPDTYRYIPESIRRYPGAIHVNTMILRLGFSASEYVPVLAGLMAIHHARK
jgi:demethylmenaquinone methyltransferase/2-methoxy-6-polyprenyl-1,4-benzoquinol methylase